MPVISSAVLDLTSDALAQRSAAVAGAAFFDRLRPYGVRAIYARALGLPGSPPSEQQVLSRISPPGWEALYADKQFDTVNHLPRESRRRSRPFTWSDIKVLNSAELELVNILKDNGFPDGIGTPCHGAHGYLGIISLAFEQLRNISPDERLAIEVASVVMHDRMRDLAVAPVAWNSILTARERECMLFVADGFSDNEIGDRMTIADTTVATHIQNAKRKLGARTRAQAVAQCFLKGLL